MALTKDPRTISSHDVELVLTPNHEVSDEALEQLTLDVERVFYEHGCGEQFSVAVACSFDPPGIEIDMSICAVSAAVVNRRIGEALADLDKHLGMMFELRGQNIESHAGAD